MDVKFVLVCLALAGSLAACSQKSASNVFPDGENGSQSKVCGESAITNEFIVEWEDGRRTLERDANPDAFKANLLEPRLAEIRHAEFNRRIRLHREPSSVAVSASFSNEWGQQMIEAPALWAQSVKGNGIVVAVTDTAVDLTHPALASRIQLNEREIPDDGIDNDGNGFVDDYRGWDFLTSSGQFPAQVEDEHGSHVSGIIAADPQQGAISGVAPAAKIIPSSFLSEVTGEGDTFGAIQALNYAALRGARIINASWGGGNCSPSLRTTFDDLSAKGILLVVAAGNDGSDIESSPDYPAAFTAATQITVAAVRYSGTMASFSNTSYKYVNIAAPGESILSSVPARSYDIMSGTSMAAPFVSGAAALLWGAFPDATALEIRAALLDSVDKGQYRVSTQGRLNVKKALDLLKSRLRP